MIDQDGFRPNVGIIIADSQGRLLWARRVGGQNAWQFPQGGIRQDEPVKEALFRELEEEVGLTRHDVEVLGSTQGWLRYKLPKRLVRKKEPCCIGQKQKWYLLKLIQDDTKIDVSSQKPAEFDTWQWVSYWYPLGKVVAFKRDVYRRALKELAPIYQSTFSQKTEHQVI